MPQQAQGTFTVNLKPLPDPPAEGLMRMRIDKQFEGGLAASSQGEMLSAGNPQVGEAGYVAMELVTGVLDGLPGSFALQHHGTMHAGGQELRVSVVPGSGTGELAGLTGELTITVEGGRHLYSLAYTLPE